MTTTPQKAETNALTTSVARWIESVSSKLPHPCVLGLSGPQGAGKSTAARELVARAAPRLAVLGLDDFYLPRAARRKLAGETSPLFETRGPPSTHDLALLVNTVDALKTAGADASTPIPVFDKKSDDRKPQGAWRAFIGRPDVILIEGWLVGAEASADFVSGAPMNDVESADRNAAWRRRQFEALNGPYTAFWNMIDAFAHIEAPAFATILDWRAQQEEETLGLPAGGLPAARRAWVRRFIQHYERLTRAMAAGARRPGAVIRLDARRRVISYVE